MTVCDQTKAAPAAATTGDERQEIGTARLTRVGLTSDRSAVAGKLGEAGKLPAVAAVPTIEIEPVAENRGAGDVWWEAHRG